MSVLQHWVAEQACLLRVLSELCTPASTFLLVLDAPAWQALKSKHDSTDLVLEVETTDYLEEHYNYVYDPESREGKVLKSLVLAPGQVLAVVHIKNLTGLQTKQVARVVRDCAFIEGGDIPVQGALHLKDCVPMESESSTE